MNETTYSDAFLGTDLGVVDPDIDAIIGCEEERQARKLILIPSESMAPRAVRQALGLCSTMCTRKAIRRCA